MPHLTLRPATPADVPLILDLVRELAEYEREPDAAVATEAQMHRALFADPRAPAPEGGPGAGIAECVMGEVDGVTQGFALFFHNFSTWTGRPGIFLEDLFVRPEARGVGLGKALLQHLAKLAVERGCGRLQWSVLDWNTSAIDFYKSLGAEPMDEWTVYRVNESALTKLAGRG
ncbi:MAG: N-acetyltransferase family protein [Phycisphaerales bacterium]